MTLSTATTEDQIVNRLKTINPRVYVSAVPSDITPKYPLMVCYFGGPVRAARGRHITSTRNDPLVGYLTVQVTSLTDTSARDVNDLVRDSLVGFVPDNSGEMVLEGGLSYSSGNNDAPPVKYYRESAFSYVTNRQWVN